MNISDPRFKYTPSTETNIRKLFAKVRKQLADQKRELAEQRDKHDETKHVVRQIKVGEGK